MAPQLVSAAWQIKGVLCVDNGEICIEHCIESFALFPQGIADLNLAYQCFRLALSVNNDHAESYNNLGVLEMKKGHIEMVVYHSN